MIALITGTLLEKKTSQLVVEANGIGYLVFIPLSTYYELPEENHLVKLNIYTSLKQDSISLFGFSTLRERDIFQLMLSVSGIGPKLATNILSGISVDELVGAIRARDLKRLINVPGVGKKMAERMLLELQEKVLKLAWDNTEQRPQEMPSLEDQLMDDAISALVNLGYKNQAAKEAIEKVLSGASGSLTLDSLLKQTLRFLSG
ncbi:MAG: Holliday junction branch migration protein RuvA [Smithellaceae bacterium]|nr:Holliday junction branch migration protein RuvA [Smithellaceae bacterium]